MMEIAPLHKTRNGQQNSAMRKMKNRKIKLGNHGLIDMKIQVLFQNQTDDKISCVLTLIFKFCEKLDQLWNR